MYDTYPDYDIPQKNIVQRFFGQRWSAILLEIVLTIVITVAAGSAFEFFDPFERDQATAEPTASVTEPFRIALLPFTERGIAHIQKREFAAAEAMVDLAIAVAPEDADYHALRGYVNLQTGDFPDAQVDFRRVVALGQTDSNTHAALCWAYGETGDYATAMRHCDEALVSAQSLEAHAIALENRCWVQVEMGKWDAAAGDCLAVLELLPACQQEVCALAHYNMGRIMLAQGDEDLALRQFNLAIHIGSAYPEMYLAIAEFYDRLGYARAAATSYGRYRSLTVGGA